MDSGVGMSHSAGTPSAERGLGPGDFAAFFRDVHGDEPFPWQQRLTNLVLSEGKWPEVIDLPTGTGKTAVLDTAVFAMALQPEVSPRRVVFVIDRRIVVDQVHKRATCLKEQISRGSTPILRAVRARLARLSDGDPLGVAALRGGIPLDAEWTHRPDQPWVLVSTVDQFGSRLLFRGYGVSPGMRPIHAGLAGNDCLVILDEVHLSTAFAQTLNHVARLASARLPRRFVTVEMSATPKAGGVAPFTLNSATDLDRCDELRRRVEAKKRASLSTVRDHDAVPAQVLNIVKSTDKAVTKDGSAIRSVGVIVNRVRSARETYTAVADAGFDTHLITGRMRPLDRVRALTAIADIVDPDRNQKGDRLAVVVATQAIEVGADFSFDALITECAPVDSLRQRFGRLDRRGRYGRQTGKPAQAWVIGPKDVVESKRPDPVYGHSTRITWEELQRQAANGEVDVGPMSLRDFPEDANSPKRRAPLLLTTHLDAWTQTRPEPIVQPAVDWFLHGIDTDPTADVSVVWRWDRSLETLRLVPPRQAECVQVPVGAAKAWLEGASEIDLADVSGGAIADGPLGRNAESAVDWVRWAGLDDDPESIAASDIRPGDVLIVDPDVGGLGAGTWDPSSKEPVADLGDAAQFAYRQRATLRLDPRLLGQYAQPTVPPRPADESTAEEPLSDRIAVWLDSFAGKPNATGGDIAEVVQRLRERRFESTAVGVGEDASNAYYVLAELHANGKRVVDVSVMDGSDEAGSFTGADVPLGRHLAGVGNRAAEVANRLGLPPEIANDLRCAGALHDLGKVDPRFQLQLVGGDRIDLEKRRGEPLAKSLPGVRQVRVYPRGMRHEIASVAMIESNRGVLDSAVDKDLVLHLVGTHHGWGRPLPPILADSDPQTLTFTLDGQRMEANSDLTDGSLALDMAERFWRLIERYGYYGLAWLEAILRLADHRQSAEEAKQA